MDEKQKFDLVVQLGKTMLVSGGEVYRVNDTMERVAKSLGLKDFSAYVVTNGIIASTVVEGGLHSAQVQNLPLLPITLCRVEAINSLSREIVEGKCTVEEAKEKLEKIRTLTVSSDWMKVAAAGVGCASFAFLSGGTFYDALFAAIPGVILYIFLLFAAQKLRLPQIIRLIVGSGLVTLICIIAYTNTGFLHFDAIIIGSIFPMVPGIPLTNSVRNFLDNDYLSGMIRMVDAILVAACIAIGVGSMLMLWRSIMGVNLI